MAKALADLIAIVDVCVISGGQYEQFQKQVIEKLPPEAAGDFARLHLMPTCGTQYYLYQKGEWVRQYSEDLTADEKKRALADVEQEAKRLGFWEAKTAGPILEDRGSQITFSALGQAAAPADKKAWDPTGEKKNTLRGAVQALLPDLEVRSGGSTSIDITRHGIDKAYGMNKLAQLTGIPLDAMLFAGDRLDPDGNDYPVKAMGVTCHAVKGWEDTAAFVEDFLALHTPTPSTTPAGSPGL